MHIIVPLDGSLLAERAIAPAGLLAHRAAEADITLLAVNTQKHAQETIADEFSADVASGIPDSTPKYLRYLILIHRRSGRMRERDKEESGDADQLPDGDQ
jgi:hypothetical protein